MSNLKSLTVQKRSGLGKGPNRRLREKLIVPGVYYTEGNESISIQAVALAVDKIFAEFGRTTIFNLEIEDNGKKTVHPVLIWDIQFHPYKKQMTHIDFYGVDLEKDIKITVPLEFVGTSRGVKAGGTFEVYREKVLLVGKPQFMPRKIVVDITETDINKTMRVNDLKFPEGVKPAGKDNYPILAVVTTVAVAEDAPL